MARTYMYLNPTVPDLLRANMPVSYSELQAELRSLERAIQYHSDQFLIRVRKADSVLALDLIPYRHLEKLEEERKMFVQAIKVRRVRANRAAIEAILRSNRAYTEIPGSWPKEA
jgi:hypothetical protein